MRELFIRESDDKRVKMTGPIALIVALLFLIIFAGCSPAEKAGAANNAALPDVSTGVR